MKSFFFPEMRPGAIHKAWGHLFIALRSFAGLHGLEKLIDQKDHSFLVLVHDPHPYT